MHGRRQIRAIDIHRLFIPQPLTSEQFSRRSCMRCDLAVELTSSITHASSPSTLLPWHADTQEGWACKRELPPLMRCCMTIRSPTFAQLMLHTQAST